MRLLIFLIRNCKDCESYVKRLVDEFRFSALDIKLYDVDDEKNFLMSMNAVRKYKVMKMPSAVLLEGEEHTLYDGLDNLERLINDIHGKRHI
jgi:hypothetical protein